LHNGIDFTILNPGPGYSQHIPGFIEEGNGYKTGVFIIGGSIGFKVGDRCFSSFFGFFPGSGQGRIFILAVYQVGAQEKIILSAATRKYWQKFVRRFSYILLKHHDNLHPGVCDK